MAQVEEHFFPLPFVQTWADRMDDRLILRVRSTLFEECVSQMETRHWKPLRMHLLPSPIPANPYGRLIGSCSVVRYKTPSDFHLIFLDGHDPDFSHFDSRLKNMIWKKTLTSVLEKETNAEVSAEDLAKYCFQSTTELFSGLSALMKRFVLFLHHAYGTTNKNSPEVVAANRRLVQGDLVVAMVSRGSGTRCKTICYRGVILQRLERIEPEPHLVYLIDTGEKITVPRMSLRPLPEVFLRFAPMAVKCALNGVSPIGPDWNISAREKMRELILELKSKPKGEIHAEFCYDFGPKKKESEVEKEKLKMTPAEQFYKLIDPTPHFVELFFTSKLSAVESTNFSSFLVEEMVALEWALIPQRRYLRTPFVTGTVCGDGKIALNNFLPTLPSSLTLISRLEAMSLANNPFQVKNLDKKLLEQEIRGRLIRDKRLEKEILRDHKNIFSIKIQDPKRKKAVPCIPKVFLEHEK